MVLTRQEKEDLVLNLYNQGRTYREIAKEARMSPRDIGVIVNRTAEKKEMEKAKEYQDTQNIDEQKQDKPKLSLSTQAYRLFSKGKTPIEVAIILDLVASEVSRYFKEYLNLKQLHGFYLAYEETEGEIEPFLKLYELSKAKGMGTKQVVNLLEIANNDLPALENRYNRLKKEADHIEYKNVNLNLTLHNIENQIITSSQTLDSYNLAREQERMKYDCLRNERMGLRKMVRQFKRNNEEYLKIKTTVEQEVTRILLEGKELLSFAFYSLMESMRKDPGKYSSIIYYNNASLTTSCGGPFYEPSYTYGQQYQQYLSSDSFFDAYKITLLDDAEKLYKTLVREKINSIIANYVSKSASIPSAATVNSQFESIDENKVVKKY
jgi:DNA-binding CsgD family transcriptional regulator